MLLPAWFWLVRCQLDFDWFDVSIKWTRFAGVREAVCFQLCHAVFHWEFVGNFTHNCIFRSVLIISNIPECNPIWEHVFHAHTPGTWIKLIEQHEKWEPFLFQLQVIKVEELTCFRNYRRVVQQPTQNGTRSFVKRLSSAEQTRSTSPGSPTASTPMETAPVEQDTTEKK